MGTDSRAAGALLARASTLHLQTGNLLNWGRLRKKCPSTHSEEVSAVGPGPPGKVGWAGGLRDIPRASGQVVGGWGGQAGRARAPPAPEASPGGISGELGCHPA